MKRFILSLCLSLTVLMTGAANAQDWQGKDKKPEKPVEKPKDDKPKDPPRDNRGGGDKKKPDGL